MRIIEETQLDFSDVLIQPKRSSLNSRKEVELERTFSWTDANNVKRSFTAKPFVCAANMGTVGTINMARILAKNHFMSCLEKHYSADEIVSFFNELKDLAISEGLSPSTYYEKVFVSIGIREPIETLIDINKQIPLIGINIDVPNAYIPKMLDRVKEIRSLFPSAFIIAGTVVTGDIAQDLLNAGANCLRANIGAGSVCSTRLKTGVGRPAFSTIVEVADAVHQIGGYCMCDGGCTCPGDICKALCAGADFVMTGSLLAGCEEADGNVITIDGKKYKQYYGMSSKLAQEKHFGGFQNHRASEGREKLIPYTGSLEDILQDISGSVRSCCTYIGSKCIKHMPRQATFYKVHNQLNTKFASCKDI